MLTALQMAEQLELMAQKLKGQRHEELRGVLKMAEKQMREKEKALPLTEDEVRLLMAGTERGMEYAVYVEDRGYYKPMPALMDSAMVDSIRVTYSNGMRYMLEMRDYNRTWRLWEKYPSGVEMKMKDWRSRK